MNPSERQLLTTRLRDHVSRIAIDLRAQMRVAGPPRDRARKLWADEGVSEDFEVWTDLLSRRGAVLWVLKSVYVRVLEDRGLLSPGRLFDVEHQQLFEKLAPNLGETAFLKWVYRDLARPEGGLPELFSPQPAEVAYPSNDLSRALITFWREADVETGKRRWGFAEERFEGELMGDLYQELDPVVKERFALCQTPDFVRAFILDRTLTPALETFGADKVRLLDPACGSGHFLIDGLKRLVAATGEKHPEWRRDKVVAHALPRVVGIDLNDYACALARTRLIMTAAELAGVETLAEASKYHPHVYCADGLEQVERDEPKKAEQQALFAGEGGKSEKAEEERTKATLTRPEVKAALRRVLEAKFQAVVANPPYITESDDARKTYHREKVGKGPRYVSAYRQYSLGAPFTERCFQLAVKEGFVGLITSNNFMKREFGKPLIEKVLSGVDLTLVVDTSQAYIPFHGTPTVLLFGRSRAGKGDTVRAVMAKRGETGVPEDPAKGKVWSSIAKGWDQVGFENDFVSVAEMDRKTLSKHPWSLGGGGAAELRAALDVKGTTTIGALVEIGTGAVTREDDVYLVGQAAAARMGIPPTRVRPLVEGETIRDWAISDPTYAIWPYDPTTLEASDGEGSPVSRALWRWRTRLKQRVAYGKTQIEHGLKWFEYSMFFAERFRTPLTITLAFVATHNQFALDRGGKIFNRTAPIIKFPANTSEREHLALLGLLNSSTACFWMKQVFHCKGSQGINEGMKSAAWEQFFEFDATKLALFPIAAHHQATEPYAEELDRLARGRSERSVRHSLDVGDWTNARGLLNVLQNRRSRDTEELQTMVGLQEELDWLCYRLYGLDGSTEIIAPSALEPMPPTWLPWVLDLAERDAANRAQIASGEEPDDIPTAWFERHGWEPLLTLPVRVSPALAARIQERRALIKAVPALALIESPAYKRRWYRPDYAEEEQQALQTWLADQIEAVSRERERGRAFTVEQIVSALQADSRVLAVCEVLTGQRDFSLHQLVASAIDADTVPSHPFHVYKETGLDKRAAWERTWEMQRLEDAGEKVTPEVPPAYTQADFLKPAYYRHRGKLDVPKERFIAFTEVPGRGPSEILYGRAGWTPLERIRALLAIDEELEDAGTPKETRQGVLDSAWRLLPDAARDDAATASRLKAELQSVTTPEGPNRDMVARWAKRAHIPTVRTKKTRRATAKVEDPEEEPAELPAEELLPLASAQIVNFRGIRDVTIRLHPKVTVFFGPNAAGKTTILNAIGAALAPIVKAFGRSGAREISEADVRLPWKTGEVPGEKAGVPAPYARVTLTSGRTLSWDVTRIPAGFDRDSAPDSPGTANLDNLLGPLFKEVARTAPGEPGRPLPLVAAYGTERGSLDAPQRDGAFEGSLERLQALDHALQSKSRFAAVLDWFQAAEDEERREQTGRRDFDYRLPALQWVRTAIERALPECKNPRTDTKPLRMMIDYHHLSDPDTPSSEGALAPEPQTLDARSLSDGYRTHFALVADLARRMVQLNPTDDMNDPERGTNTRAVVLIDEIDLHLDPWRQGLVLGRGPDEGGPSGLKGAFPNAQFVLTTHSEQVIGSVTKDCVRQLWWADGEIVVGGVKFAQGASSERILTDLMGTDERLPGPVTEKLRLYRKRVHRGEGHTEEVRGMRAELEQELPGDPALRDADTEMRRQQIMARFGKEDP